MPGSFSSTCTRSCAEQAGSRSTARVSRIRMGFFGTPPSRLLYRAKKASGLPKSLSAMLAPPGGPISIRFDEGEKGFRFLDMLFELFQQLLGGNAQTQHALHLFHERGVGLIGHATAAFEMAKMVGIMHDAGHIHPGFVLQR